MITRHRHIKHEVTLILLAVATTVVVVLAGAGTVLAAPPVKLALSSHITNGFEYPESVAVNNDPHSPEYGDVYVFEGGHGRVQVLSATGAFVEMFGQEVNETTKGNVCTAISGNTCQAGVQGSAPGQFSDSFSIAVDPSDGNVFVAEQVEPYEEFGERVQEFTAEGRFVLEIGKAVNTTKDKETGASDAEKNLCSELEICGAPGVYGSQEDGAFKFESGAGNLLAVGGTGSKDLLYVGEERRVQEFEAVGGNWAGEISLTSIPTEEFSNRVQALAFDQESGNVYLVYQGGRNIVREFDPENNTEVANITLGVQHERGRVEISGVAMDLVGDLAVVGVEDYGSEERHLGSLYNAVSGRRVSEFPNPSSNSRSIRGVAFNGERDLYAVVGGEVGEVLAYTPEPIGELTATPAVCAPGAVNDTSVSFACTLNGEVNPEGVAGTEALFEWGTTITLGQRTPSETVEAPKAVSAVVSVPPNTTIHYQLAGTDQNDLTPEGFTSEQASKSIEPVPPRIAGIPSASYVSSSSADLFGEVNPENTGTTFEFQYARACTPGGSCPPIAQAPDMVATESVQSRQYGRVGTSVEVSGLAPGTTYRYQLAAKNEDGETALNETGGTTLPEGTFTTTPAPAPSVSSGVAGGVGVSTATISGSVDPDGAPTSYSFELGVYEGASTRFGVVSSGSAGAGTTPVEETLGLSGLQPDGTYAFRIAIRSGYIDDSERTLQSAPVVFTTGGVASVLALPAIPGLLPIPAIAFPTEAPGVGTTVTKTLTRAQKLAAALKVCKKEKAKSKKTKCERTARKAYGPKKSARKTSKKG